MHRFSARHVGTFFYRVNEAHVSEARHRAPVMVVVLGCGFCGNQFNLFYRVLYTRLLAASVAFGLGGISLENVLDCSARTALCPYCRIANKIERPIFQPAGSPAGIFWSGRPSAVRSAGVQIPAGDAGAQ